MSVEYRARSGIIVVAPEDVEPLLRCAAERRPAPDDEALRARLAAAGALRRERLPPRLAETLAPVHEPVCEMRVEHGTRVCHVWVGRASSTFVMPQPDGRTRIVGIPTEFVPDGLARLVRLGPRPRADARVRLRLSPSDLARLLATGHRTGRLGRDDAEAAALDAIAAGPTAHWRVEARFADGARGLEVLDAPGGLWLVRPADDVVELLPTDPTTVFTALVELLPDDDEATGAAPEGSARVDAA